MIKPPTVYYCLSCFVINIREYSETFDDHVHVAFAQVEHICAYFSHMCRVCIFNSLSIRIFKQNTKLWVCKQWSEICESWFFKLEGANLKVLEPATHNLCRNLGCMGKIETLLILQICPCSSQTIGDIYDFEVSLVGKIWDGQKTVKSQIIWDFPDI